MLKFYIQISLLLLTTCIISSATFVHTEQNVIYVIQLSAGGKIWTDAEFKAEFNRFKSLNNYGFVYENSYLNANGIQYSRLYLGTYEDQQTAKSISLMINQQFNIQSFVKTIKKRTKLKDTPAITSNIQKGKLEQVITYQDIEHKGGTGTVLIRKIEGNEYFFTLQTYDNHLLDKLLPNNHTESKPKKTPPSGKPNSTLVAKNKIHIIKKGDTLFKIAKQYGLTISELKRLNNLKDNTIKIGQRLTVKK